MQRSPAKASADEWLTTNLVDLVLSKGQNQTLHQWAGLLISQTSALALKRSQGLTDLTFLVIELQHGLQVACDPCLLTSLHGLASTRPQS